MYSVIRIIINIIIHQKKKSKQTNERATEKEKPIYKGAREKSELETILRTFQHLKTTLYYDNENVQSKRRW